MRVSTAGRASSGTKLRVVVDGTPAPPGEEGELAQRYGRQPVPDR